MKNNQACKFQIKNMAYFLILTAVFILIVTFSAAAEDYILQGDEIIFMEQSGLVIFEGSPSFKSKDFVVSADKFELDTQAKTIKALNNVLIESEKDDLRGESLEYNYQTEQGALYGAAGSIGEIYFSGSKLDILATSPIKAVFEKAEFTPCSRKEPHYHFKAKKIRINSDNTLEIYDIVPYIGNLALFRLPYYSVSYDPEGEPGKEFESTFPLPQLGYSTKKGVSVEFSYPYQIGESNSGKIYYLKEGSDEERDEIREFTNNQILTENLTFKNRYYYLYDYDFEDEKLDEEIEEFSSYLAYHKDSLKLETGIIRDFLLKESESRYFFDGEYRFKSGLKTAFRKEYSFEKREFIKTIYKADYRFQSGVNSSFRQEYDSQDLIKQNYSLNYNGQALAWDLKYVDGEDYNYYPYLNLSLPAIYSFKPAVGFGRVENGGVELNKIRLNLDFNQSWQLPGGFSYHLAHDYRLDHYQSTYDQNYHYFKLNTGLKQRQQLNERLSLSTSLFYEEDRTVGESPLPDDREDKKRLIKPALSLEIKGDYPDSSWTLGSDGIYDLLEKEWDELNLRLIKKEDCFNFNISYEFIDRTIGFALEL